MSERNKGWPGKFWIDYYNFLVDEYQELWLIKGTEIEIWKDYFLQNILRYSPHRSEEVLKPFGRDMDKVASSLVRAERFLRKNTS